MKRILTVGHSTHTFEKFLELVNDQGVTAIADVRSIPASKFTPQFSRQGLEQSLRQVGIKYVFLGKELGARTDDLTCYESGRVVYSRLARTQLFQSGIRRLEHGAEQENIAIMCAEQEPLDCHRTLLVSRILEERGIPVAHILPDGKLEAHSNAMSRLMTKFGLDHEDLFHTKEELLSEALDRQEQKIAYVLSDSVSLAHHG